MYRRAGEFARITAVLVLLIACTPAAGAREPAVFDHLTTGFELRGAHEELPCEACHAGGVFEATPRDCAGCHSTGARLDATGKPLTHVLSSQRCEACHTQASFSLAVQFDHGEVQGTCGTCHNDVQAPGKPPDHVATTADCGSCHVTTHWGGAAFDHSTITGNCVSCHDGVRATGRNAAHIQSSNTCESCHSVAAWQPAVRVDHSQVSGTCFICHNGTSATGKSPTHIASGNECETCHTTNAWTPARFDHAGVMPGTCSSCHNGVRATGKPVTHVPTTAECDSCHSTLAWRPAGVDHSGITGNCASCHDGAAATGKSPGHMATARDCVVCHRYPAWTPLVFTHTSPDYPGDHRGPLACNACHTTNTDQATWQFPAYRPNCAGCHADDFEPGPHDRTTGGQNYTAGELQNCSGACHVYTDATLTTIARPRPGPEHRVSQGDF